MPTTFIPRIDYEEGSLSGTSSIGSDTITGITDTSAVKVGMVFEGTGIPAGAKVVSKTASTVVLDLDATAAGTETFTFNFRIDFELPPKGDTFGEQYKWKGTSNRSRSGKLQSVTDYITLNNKVEFSHVSQEITDDFVTFFKDWGITKPFSYYTDKGDVSTKRTVEWDEKRRRLQPKVITRKGAGLNFLWRFTMEVIEVVG